MSNKVVLLNLSGYGISYSNKNNPINSAYKPNLDYLFASYPYSNLVCYGKPIGLNSFQPGNNRYNHLALGLANKPYILSSLINKSIEDNSFYVNDVLASAFKKVRDNFSNLHVICFLTNKSNLSNFNHLVSLIKMAKYYSLSKEQLLFDVVIDDDITMNNLIALYNSLLEIIKSENVGIVNTIIGEKYAFNRDNNFKYTLRYYNLLTRLNGNSIDYFDDYILNQYNLLDMKKGDNNLGDINPAYYNNRSIKLNDDDIILSTIFDGEYVNQILSLLSNPKSVKDLDIDSSLLKKYQVIKFDSLIDKNNKAISCFKRRNYKNNLTNHIRNHKLTQLRISDDFYYSYLNKYFDGISKNEIKDVKRVKIINPYKSGKIIENYYKVDNLIKDRLIEELNKTKYDFTMVSFSSLDLLGHLGNDKLIVQAIENLDKIVKQIYSYCNENDLLLMICSDHSNAEKIIDNSNYTYIEHTSNKVPFCIVSNQFKIKRDGTILDISNYICQALQIDNMEIDS